MKKYLSLVSIKSVLARNKLVLVFFIISLALFYINSFHEQYTDEWDNLLGGSYILRGILPFSGFFSHHGPVAYFVSAFVQIFSGHSFVRFRVLYNIAFLLGMFWFYYYLSSRFGKVITRFYLYFIVLLGIAATYFWQEMLLADSLSAIFLTPVFIFFILKYTYKEKIIIKDLWLISFCTSLALLTSLTYLYLCFVIYFFVLFAYYQDYHSRLRSIQTIKLFGILALPYIIFLLYLLITGSLSDYIYQSVIFNEKYYIYNYPGLQNGHINPIRFAIVILHAFYGNFFTLLVQVGNFNLGSPLNITMAIVDTSLLVYYFIRRNYALVIFIFLYMVYANARSNPLDSKETDYQSAVYIMMSLVSICFALPMFFQEIHLQISQGKKIIVTVLFVVCSIYSFFSTGWLINKFSDKAYGKYMGLAPLIYDRSDIAPLVNSVIGANDNIWIGPLDFQDYYYVSGKLASKYHILIPGMGKSDKIQQEFIADMNAHKPKIILFNQHYYILGDDPAKYATYFTSFLNTNYMSLSKLGYTATIDAGSTYNLNTDLYINKNDIQDVTNTLLKNDFIKPSI